MTFTSGNRFWENRTEHGRKKLFESPEILWKECVKYFTWCASNPLLDVDISNATGALINIIGGNDMSLDEARAIISTVGEKLSPDAKLIWGAQISPEMEKTIRVMIIITGVKSSQIMGGELPKEIQKQVEIGNELGIEFLE